MQTRNPNSYPFGNDSQLLPGDLHACENVNVGGTDDAANAGAALPTMTAGAAHAAPFTNVRRRTADDD